MHRARHARNKGRCSTSHMSHTCDVPYTQTAEYVNSAPENFLRKKFSTPRAFLFPYFALQAAPKALIFIVFSTYFITFPHLATVLRTRTYDLWLLRTRDLVENRHIQEQILLIFLCHIKNWHICFPANVFAIRNPSKSPCVHEQIKSVTKSSHQICIQKYTLKY